jgi:UDP-N-acetylglucosamine--dolichyl-phosphate N-acetylglucosaminephosphotransferase
MAESEGVLVLSCMLGATLGFLWYNRYPARILLGNVGSLALGVTIGAAIVVSGFLVAGFVMLIPHTVNFLLYVYWRVMHRLYPEDKRWQIVKFGRVRDDGTLEVPNRLTLKWILPSYIRMTEKQAVLAMYALTIPFCVLGLFIPY